MLQKMIVFIWYHKYLKVQQKIHAHFSSIHRLENTLGSSSNVYPKNIVGEKYGYGYMVTATILILNIVTS